MARSIIIIGVGPFVSRSLAVKMASLGWHMVLISRSIDKLEDVAAAARKAAGRDTMVLCRTADAGEPAQLLAALDWASKQLGFVDCVCYNAARVDFDDLLTVTPEILEQDFRTSVIGTLVTGQWYGKYAAKHEIATSGDTAFPLFLATAGLLHQNPSPAHASLSTVKSASYNVSLNFAQVLPKQFGIKVGIPIIVEPIIPKDGGGYVTKSDPEVIVDKVFMPFFEWHGSGGGEWVRDRVW